MKVLAISLLFLISTGALAHTKFEVLLDKYKSSTKPATIEDLESVSSCYSVDSENQNVTKSELISVEESQIDNGPQFPPEVRKTVYFSNWTFEEEAIAKKGTDLVLKSSWHLVQMRLGTDARIYFRYLLSMQPERFGYCVE